MNRTTLFSLILGAIALALGFFQVWPEYQEFVQLRNEITMKQQQLKNQEDYFSDLRRSKEQIEIYKRRLAKIDAALPLNPAIPALYHDLETMSLSSGLVLISIESLVESFDEEVDSSVLRTSAKLKLIGSYEGLKEFLSRVESSARFLNIHSIKFIIPDQEGEGITFDVGVTAYSY